MTANVGGKIKQLRKAKGMTLEKLATAIGTGKSYVWELENKGVKMPAGDRLAKIAKILDVTVDFLVDDDELEVTSEVLDTAFYRKYRKMPENTKTKIRKMVEIWDDE